MSLTLKKAAALIRFDLNEMSDTEAPQEKLIHTLREKFGELLKEASIPAEDVDVAYLIGSYSRDTQVHPYSDVDILIFSDSYEHQEFVFLWEKHLISLYVFTFAQLISGLNGVDAPHWVQSIQDAKLILGKNGADERVQEEVSNATYSLEHVPRTPLIALRRILEYRRKLLAMKSENQRDPLIVSYLGGHFMLNYLLIKSHLEGTTIETETRIFNSVSELGETIKDAIHTCQLSNKIDDVAAAMDTLMQDLLKTIDTLAPKQ